MTEYDLPGGYELDPDDDTHTNISDLTLRSEIMAWQAAAASLRSAHIEMLHAGDNCHREPYWSRIFKAHCDAIAFELEARRLHAIVTVGSHNSGMSPNEKAVKDQEVAITLYAVTAKAYRKRFGDVSPPDLEGGWGKALEEGGQPDQGPGRGQA